VYLAAHPSAFTHVPLPITAGSSTFSSRKPPFHPQALPPCHSGEIRNKGGTTCQTVLGKCGTCWAMALRSFSATRNLVSHVPSGASSPVRAICFAGARVHACLPGGRYLVPGNDSLSLVFNHHHEWVSSLSCSQHLLCVPTSSGATLLQLML
jgi:hypothetical protein